MMWKEIATALLWVFLLACPLAMFWMMRGKHGGGSGGKMIETESERTAAPAAPVRSQEQEIRELRERLVRLEAETPGAPGADHVPPHRGSARPGGARP